MEQHFAMLQFFKSPNVVPPRGTGWDNIWRLKLPSKYLSLQDVLDSHLITNIRGSHAANPDRDSAVLFDLCPHTIDLHSGETEAPVGNAESQIIIVVGEHV